jgi:hypothetical protein
VKTIGLVFIAGAGLAYVEFLIRIGPDALNPYSPACWCVRIIVYCTAGAMFCLIPRVK